MCRTERFIGIIGLCVVFCCASFCLAASTFACDLEGEDPQAELVWEDENGAIYRTPKHDGSVESDVEAEFDERATPSANVLVCFTNACGHDGCVYPWHNRYATVYHFIKYELRKKNAYLKIKTYIDGKQVLKTGWVYHTVDYDYWYYAYASYGTAKLRTLKMCIKEYSTGRVSCDTAKFRVW